MKLPVIFIFITSTCFAQTGFYTRSIDFTNCSWEHHPSENLGTILLDAHLRGHLEAYKFNVAHDILKYAPLSKEETPDPWDSKLDYYMEDMVLHKGNVYITGTDIAHGSSPPDSSRMWQYVDMHGPVISMHHHFPTAADSTTRSFLLSHLIEEQPMSYDPWMEGIEYFHNDRVEHQGQTYEALGNNFAAVIPGTNEKYWAKIDSKLKFFQSQDLNIINVLYHYQVKGNDTIHTPQMVSAMVMDPYKEVLRNIGLNFFYSDVIKYLSNAPQPLLYQSGIGQIEGGTFLLDKQSKVNFSRWLRGEILSGSKEIKPGKKSVLDEHEYKMFLETKPADFNHINWYPVQNPGTHDFTLISGKLSADYDYYTVPTLSIPYKSLEKFLKATPQIPALRSYRDVLTKNFLVSSIDTVVMDSIEALPAVSLPQINFGTMYFDELQFDNIDGTPILQNHVPKLWQMIAANKPGFQTTASYYPCNFNWAGTEITWSTGSMIATKDFSISHVTLPPTELPKSHWKLKQAGVVYRINKLGKHTPLQLVILFEDEPHSDLIHYRVDWNDVVKLVAGKSEFNDFVTAVQKATISFRQTSISYGYLMKP
jgi:hypothetical protein